jgi:hypothetical protein
LLATLLIVAGCAGGGGSSSSGAPTEVSTFDRIQTQVFARSCTSDSCHGSIGRAGDMVLEGDLAYDSLVSVPATNPTARKDGMQRVMPGDPARSFLLSKLTDTLGSGMGDAMPRGAAELDETTVDLIRAWIVAGAPRDGRIPADDGGPLNGGGTDDGGMVSLPPPLRGVQLSVTARPVPEGKEETLCHYLKMPSDVDFDVNRFQVAVTGGSHHIHLYRPFDSSYSVPDGFEECNKAVDFNVWELVVAAQLRRTDWELPAGVAYHFRAGEQLLVQTHFVNVGSLETRGEGHVLMNLQEAEPGTVRDYGGSLFGQDRDVFVAAHSNPTESADCVFQNPITLMAMTGHYHFRGRRFTSTVLDVDGNLGAEIYHHEGYDDPAFTTYSGPTAPQFLPGEGFRWTCYWENPTDNDYKFGPFTDTNEHCNVFAFYYPARSLNEATYCVKDKGVSTTTVKSSN